MKPHLDIAHTGTLGSDDRTGMTFDENAIAHLMSVLTDLYSDPALAVIREYSTNALDSHRAAGNPDPIHVTLPSPLVKTFKVRDWGVGMSASQIREQFSKYGWSSKRENDDEVGMLGLGCKSGLSYTSQFTMTCIKNNEKILVLVTRQDDGAGAVQIISTEPTEEPNGVEVEIPVRGSANEFCQKARTFFEYWEPGTVRINEDEPIEYNFDRPALLKLDPDVCLMTNDHAASFAGWGKSVIVMGNVPYPVDHDLFDYKMNFIARVPIGSVDFTPSREALHYTKRTKSTIKTIIDFALERKIRAVRDQIEASPTHAAAIENTHRFRKFLPRGVVITYRGEEIPLYLTPAQQFDVTGKELPGSVTEICRLPGSVLPDRAIHRGRLFECSLLDSTLLIVTGHRGSVINKSLKDKARKFCDDNGIPDIVGRIVFVSAPFEGEWASEVATITLDELRAVKLPKVEGATPRTKREPGRYVRLDESAATTSAPLTKDDPLPEGIECWYPAGDLTGHNRNTVARYAKGKVALVYKASVEWFQNQFPGLPTLDAWLKDKLDNSDPKWSTYFGYGYSSHPHVSMLAQKNPEKILDPDLRTFMRRFVAEYDRFSGDGDPREAARAVGLSVPRRMTSGIVSVVEKAIESYPLLNTRVAMNSADLLEYVNALYITRQGLHLIPA